MSMTIESTVFHPGEKIPRKFTGDGEDVSPPLHWRGVPAGTAELALICDDPDAPTPEPWVHWVIYKLAPTVTALPEGMPPSAQVGSPVAACQGKNSWPSGRTIGYRGPAPPHGHGVHHYHFTLYALDIALNLKPGADKERLLQAMSGHILAEAAITGTCQR
jgi:Raf kinase inhibitor-like YbhB/YbcL family protein